MNAAVIDVLQRAGSQDPNVLKPAEGMLREWETQSGFYTALCVSLFIYYFFNCDKYLLIIIIFRMYFLIIHCL